MYLKTLAIQNYKSLRDVVIRPSDFTVLIGPNGAGKSNLASAFDFLGDIYQNGLEYAVAKKGGYENIAFRRIRRTKAAISFSIEASLSHLISRRMLLHRAFRMFRRLENIPPYRLTVKHSFAFKAAQQTLAADYILDNETIELTFTRNVSPRRQQKTLPNMDPPPQLDSDLTSFSVTLERKGAKITSSSTDVTIGKDLKEYLRSYNDFAEEEDRYDIFLRSVFPPIASALGAVAVHQFSPQISRGPGAPSPNPKLTEYGQNLPALVDWLQRHHKKAWSAVVSAMRDIVPNLEEIQVGYLHTKQLGLFFKEENFGRPWAAEDVSDGTIQTLAIMAALADPRNAILFIEEPENSIHPWIVRQIAAQLKKLSKSSQVFVTTHSPLVLNVVEPTSVLVCYKKNGETDIRPLTELAPQLIADWEDGADRLFDLLDTGCVPQAVPLPGEMS